VLLFVLKVGTSYLARRSVHERLVSFLCHVFNVQARRTGGQMLVVYCRSIAFLLPHPKRCDGYKSAIAESVGGEVSCNFTITDAE